MPPRFCFQPADAAKPWEDETVRTWVLLLSLLALATSGHAGNLPLSSAAFEIRPLGLRDAFYCQDPELTAVYNMSSGFDSEIADDIPDDLAGGVIERVTFWVGEWYGSWQDPDGVMVNFYNGSCPPDLDPTLSFMIPWEDWETELVYTGIATVYEATASLPAPVLIEEGMSIGGFVVMSWGHDEPFCGLCATPEWAISGCGEAYLDGEWWGYFRWTRTSHYTGIPRDFAYCLSGDQTSIGDNHPTAVTTRLGNTPNPFFAETTLRYALTQGGPVRLVVYDIAGRLVDTVADEHQRAGEHALGWDGRDKNGEVISAGVYFARLEAASRTEISTLVLMR